MRACLPPLAALWLGLLVAGCELPRPGPETPAPAPVAPAEGAPTDPALSVDRLLPVRYGRVLWYRASQPAREGRPAQSWPVAFFPVWDPEGGLYLESLGLAPEPGTTLRLIARTPGLWAVSTTDHEAGEVLALYHQARGGAQRELIARLRGGQVEAVRVERSQGAVTLRCWFVLDEGLERLALEVGGEERLVLERVEDVRMSGNERDYPRDTPAATWASLERAVRRLDVSALERLLAPELRARLGTASRDAAERLGAPTPLGRLHRRDREAERIRAVISDLLAVRLEPRGAWKVEPHPAATPGQPVDPRPRATCPATLRARVDGELREAPATIELVQDELGWRWAGFSEARE